MDELVLKRESPQGDGRVEVEHLLPVGPGHIECKPVEIFEEGRVDQVGLEGRDLLLDLVRRVAPHPHQPVDKLLFCPPHGALNLRASGSAAASL